MIKYQVSCPVPASHYFAVSMRIENPDPAGQALRLPNWIPGSYMIRDFARNLLDLRATCDGTEIALEQLDKSNWRAAPCDGELGVEYLVYAKDLSVRTAYLDHTRGYYNGSSLFLEAPGLSQEPCEVMIEKPADSRYADWRLATSMKRKQAEPFGFGLYEAADYDELIDHPVEMGAFTVIPFEACGVPHDIVLAGRFDCDPERLAADLKAICEHHIRFFGEPAPMDYYQFQVMVVGDGYGGLEHRASTSLVASRASLPLPGDEGVGDDYRDFLGLCSHEYFHTWNVKRIKPEAYRPCDLQQEVYTDLLWAFEGITSYYDDLALRRAGLIDAPSYLELLAQTMTRVRRGPGRLRQSAAESSFNTWTKFYKQDENAANAIVSYYAKGSLIAACIDLRMRLATGGEKSLDDVMRRLWRDFLETGEGIAADRIQRLVSEFCGEDLGDFLEGMIYGTGDLPLPRLLEEAGIEVAMRAQAGAKDKGGKPADKQPPAADLGAILQAGEGAVTVQRVREGGAAQSAGLAAGDQLVAVDGLKLDIAKIEERLGRAKPGDVWQVHAFRRDELHCLEIELQAAEENTYLLAVGDPVTDTCRAWLRL
ncbi:MAG: PDZ domain-containing protein [Gammaproteobacteria bacterium]|jgi:predicted metalloprotease with PDZ domain